MSLPHEKLVVCQRADDLFIAIHQLAMKYPRCERFGLVSQMRRAAYSVPANIVEGIARRSITDRIRFLNIAEGSLAEVAYCLHASERLGYLSAALQAEYRRQALQVGAPLAAVDSKSQTGARWRKVRRG